MMTSFDKMKTFLGTNDSQVFEMSEGIAIVEMACRTAGSNTSPEKLWQFLLAKQDGSGEVSRQRLEPWLRRDSALHREDPMQSPETTSSITSKILMQPFSAYPLKK